MKRSLVLFALSVAFLAVAAAQSVEVSYFDGDPKLRSSAGEMSSLDYDSSLKAGDSVITGKADQAELTQDPGAVIKVKPNTVFTIREIETGGQKEQVLTAVAGAVSMRFNRLAGKEPRVGTVATTAGIRGTELTIYAGPDGSSLFVVDSGLVSVESGDRTVDLAQGEGVEVSAAGVPGEKFSVIGREMDFSAWADGKEKAFLADPVAALAEVRVSMDRLRAGLDEWTAKYGAAKKDSDAAVERMKAIADKAEQAKFRDEQVYPLTLQTGNAVLNYRYYALSALSLRRYVLGAMYVRMRSLNMLSETPEYRAFRESYDEVLSDYRTAFGPYLSAVDY